MPHREHSRYLRDLAWILERRVADLGLDLEVRWEHGLLWVVGSNPNQRARRRQPDIMVLKVCERADEGSDYDLRKGGKPPRTIVEVLSESTAQADKVDKKREYEQLGVEEYYLLRPHVGAPPPDDLNPGEWLLGYRLKGRGEDRSYAKIVPEPGGELCSKVLGLSLWFDGKRLRAWDTETGKVYRGVSEDFEYGEFEAKRADEEARARKAEARRADAAELREQFVTARFEVLKRSVEALRIVLPALAPHGEWLRSGGAEGSRLVMRGIDLRGLSCPGAVLRCADLSGSDLREANLEEADLRGANLRVADLRGANLRGVNLRGAVTIGADVRGARLEGARGLPPEWIRLSPRRRSAPGPSR